MKVLAFDLEAIKKKYFAENPMQSFGSWFTARYSAHITNPRHVEYINEAVTMKQAVKKLRELGYVE